MGTLQNGFKSPSFPPYPNQDPEPYYASGLRRFRVFACASRKWSNALEATLAALTKRELAHISAKALVGANSVSFGALLAASLGKFLNDE